MLKILCKLCDAEFLVEEGKGREMAGIIMNHLINVHPSKYPELARTLEGVTMEIMKEYVIFKKE